MGMHDPSFTSESYDPDRLIAGDLKLITRDVTIISGQNLVRGTVLGKITASGKYNKSLSTANDGSETPVAILADDVDASAGDKEGPIYEQGEFNDTEITLGASHTVASVRDGLRALGIHLKSPVSS